MRSLATGIALIALVALAGAAQAATFVYVSNAEDGDIGAYTLLPDGTLVPGPRVAAGKLYDRQLDTRTDACRPRLEDRGAATRVGEADEHNLGVLARTRKREPCGGGAC